MSAEERGVACRHGFVVRVMRALVPRLAQERTSSATCIATVASGRATRVCGGRLSVHYRGTATGLTALGYRIQYWCSFTPHSSFFPMKPGDCANSGRHDFHIATKIPVVRLLAYHDDTPHHPHEACGMSSGRSERCPHNEIFPGVCTT